MTNQEVFCPSCGRQQALSEKCVDCGYQFPQRPGRSEPVKNDDPPTVAVPEPSAGDKPAAPAAARRSRPASDLATTPVSRGGPAIPSRVTIPSALLISLLALLVLLAGALVLQLMRAPEVVVEPAPEPAETPAVVEEELDSGPVVPASRAGAWTGKATAHGRTAEVSIRSVENGAISEASVVLHSGEGAGLLAGFQEYPATSDLLRRLMASWDAESRTLLAEIPFLPPKAWAGSGQRTWQVIEGTEKVPKTVPEELEDLSIFVDYLVLESTEADVLLQVGISRTGLVIFLSASRDWRRELGSGSDVVSRLVRPASEHEISRFENLVFDLSGSLNFVSNQIECTVSPPGRSTEGIALTLSGD